MQITKEIKTSLEREYALCSHAAAFYRKTVRDFELKYRLTTKTFLKRFEAGTLGDDADYFDWYAFAQLLARWQETQAALHSAVR